MRGIGFMPARDICIHVCTLLVFKYHQPMHPGRLTANSPANHPLNERNMIIFQTSTKL